MKATTENRNAGAPAAKDISTKDITTMAGIPSASTTVDMIAIEIRDEHQRVDTALHDAVKHALRCGELLQEARGQVPHGEWLPWLRDNFAFSQQTATNYMRIAKNYGTSRDLPESVNAALKGIAAPRRTEQCPGCGRAVDARKPHRCPSLIEQPPVYEIETDRQRELAEQAKERLSKAVKAIGLLDSLIRNGVGQSVAEVIKLDRAVALSDDEEIRDMISSLKAGEKHSAELRAELERRLEGRAPT